MNILRKYFSKALSSLHAPPEFNHPLDDNLPSATAGRWKSSYCCPHCKNDIGHEEWMVQICESCGETVPCVLSWTKGATRNVVRDGMWIKQKRIAGVRYLSRDGKRWERA
jgi:hypothetical protein